VHEFDVDDPRPRYEQVAEVLRHKIRDGEIPPGGKLPNHDQTRADFDVSLGTVKRAYGMLQAEGLIVTRQGQGAFVRTRPGTPAEPVTSDQLAELRRDMSAIADRLANVEQRLSEL
jgi:DNA-binding GntR family transcriptional regulator